MAPVRDKSELVSSDTGLVAAIAVETRGELGEVEPVEARSYWSQVWRRLRRDRVAIASGVFILFLIAVAAVGGPVASRLLGHGPNDIFFDGVDENLLPVGPLTWVQDPLRPGEQTLFVLGADSTLGRDEFLRLLYGARVSLTVALLAVLTTTTIGLLLGAIAGFYRGWVDTAISRLIEVGMAFPALLFIIALAATIGERLNNVTLGVFDRGVLTLLFVFTLFGWLQTARVVRGQVLSLREKEFVEAARMVGASDWKIVRSHIVPHLVAPVIVFSTLNVAAFILGEAGLSFLGLGIKLPTPSWGNLLAEAPNFYTAQPWLMVWPGLAVLLTTLAFNLLGDGLRDAFDPRSAQ
ncbi:MAG: ABC transporter permease [Actinomycetota bacterium]|nr:ABC transporter permease [Actinomycetota bacterium]